MIELNVHLKARIQTRKFERDIVQAKIDRIDTEARQNSTVSPDYIKAHAQIMPDKLDSGDTQARKTYLRSAITRIEVDDQKSASSKKSNSGRRHRRTTGTGGKCS